MARAVKAQNNKESLSRLLACLLKEDMACFFVIFWHMIRMASF
jgi:hypothetical protein